MKIQEMRTLALVFTAMILITGGVYPLLMTCIAHIIFYEKADGSIININGHAAGSSLIGQNFTGQKYFHGRPSANEYNALQSGGTNYGPTNKKYIDAVKERTLTIKKENHLSDGMKISADIVLSSASGLDPHISFDAAMLQAKRIATERGISETVVKNIITKNVEKRYFNLFGDGYVNVFVMNTELYLMDNK